MICGAESRAAPAPGRSPDRSIGGESGNQQGEAGAGAADGRRRAEGDRGRGGGGEEAEPVAGTGQVFVRAGWRVGGAAAAWGCVSCKQTQTKRGGGWKREWDAGRVR